ncbi:MAG: O-antigen ligase family protein [Johnsonella sp.]|nr:O-antigen ligase family protein [Johnsonella sp.]
MSRFKKKSSARQLKNTNRFERKAEKISEFWLISILFVLPLIFTNFYFNILPTKYITVCIASLVLILYYAYIRLSEGGEAGFSFAGIREWLAAMNRIDLCVLIFIAVCILSTLTAFPYGYQAFFGNEGRHNGLLLMLFYGASYFIVRKHALFRKRIVMLFLAAGLFICLFGISDYFDLDLLHFKKNMFSDQRSIYISTIGNINTYTAFVGFVITLSGTLFMTKKAALGSRESGKAFGELIFLYLCMTVGFMALAMGNSDNGYLTLAAFFGFLPLAVWKKRRGFRRYLIALASYFTVIVLVGMINDLYSDRVLGISGIYEYISNFRGMPHIALLFWALAAGFYGYDFKRIKEGDEGEMGILPRALWLILILILAGIVFYLIYAANTDPDVRLRKWGGLTNYLVFNDKWGTYRGYIWKATIEDYLKLPLIHKIFGTGPDTFGIYMVSKNIERYMDSVSRTGKYFDNAHNEYLHLLFTLGPIALLSYIGAIAGSVFTGIRAWMKGAEEEEGRYLLAFAFLLLAHSVQATVNLYLPITAPIAWAFMILIVNMGEKIPIQEEKKKQEDKK